MKIRAFQLLKLQKKTKSPETYIQMHNRLLIDSYVFEHEGLYLSLRGEHLKTNVYINFNKNNQNLEIFCLQLTEYLNTRKSFQICMFVVMASGKCELHIHFTFLQEF